MPISNQSKWEIKNMDTDRLKRFYNTCQQIVAVNKNLTVRQYYEVMSQAVHDELYKRKEIIE